MAWTPTTKTPLGYGRQPIKNLQEINEGERPNLPIMKPAKYLPVKTQMEKLKEYYVIEAGVVLSLDTSGYFTPCNGGVAQDITYAAGDVAYTVDADDATAFVSAAGTASAQLGANLPIGWCNEHLLSNTTAERNVNYYMQDAMPVLCDYVVELPLLWTAQTTGATEIVAGCLVKAYGAEIDATNACGAPVRWQHGADSVDQIIGRCHWLDSIAEVDNLSMVRGVRGLGLSGDGTSGIESWLVGTHQGGDAATTRVRISITLA